MSSPPLRHGRLDVLLREVGVPARELLGQLAVAALDRVEDLVVLRMTGGERRLEESPSAWTSRKALGCANGSASTRS